MGRKLESKGGNMNEIYRMRRFMPLSPGILAALAWLACLGAPCAVSAQVAASPPPGAPPDSTAGTEPKTFEEKVAELNRQILANPRDGRLYNNLGFLYTQQEEWLLARDAFIAAVQANPKEADFHLNLGNVFLKLEQYDLAVREYEAYRKFDSFGAPDAPLLIGEAWRSAGEAEKARAAFQDGIAELGQKLGTEGLRLVLALTRLQDEEGQTQQARQILQRYLPYAQRILTGEEVGAEVGSESARGVGRGADGEAGSQGGNPAGIGDGTEGNDHEIVDQQEAEQRTLAQQLVNNFLAATIADAKILQESGLAEEAAQLYEEAYTVDPSRHELIPRVVDAYLAADKEARAKVFTRHAREEDPDTPGVWIATGTLAEKELRYREAVDAFLRAKQLGYAGSDLDLKIGDLYMKLGESDKAQRYLAAGVADRDTPPEVVYNYAVSLMREQKYQEAVAPLQRVVAEAPEMPQAWQALASALRATQRYDEAVLAYEKALSFGEDPKLWFNLGFCQSRSGQEEAAVTSYRQALALDPTFKEAYYNLGRTLMSLQRYEEALEVMEEHLQIEANSYRILFNQGYCLYHLGRYEESIAQYELALEQKETADVYNNIGLAYDKLGDKEMAQTYYREAKNFRGGNQ